MKLGKAIAVYFPGFVAGWAITITGCIIQNGPIVLIGTFVMTIGFAIFWIYSDVKRGGKLDGTKM